MECRLLPFGEGSSSRWICQPRQTGNELAVQPEWRRDYISASPLIYLPDGSGLWPRFDRFIE